MQAATKNLCPPLRRALRAREMQVLLILSLLCSFFFWSFLRSAGRSKGGSLYTRGLSVFLDADECNVFAVTPFYEPFTPCLLILMRSVFVQQSKTSYNAAIETSSWGQSSLNRSR
jgi:hypothetical protein